MDKIKAELLFKIIMDKKDNVTAVDICELLSFYAETKNRKKIKELIEVLNKSQVIQFLVNCTFNKEEYLFIFNIIKE